MEGVLSKGMATLGEYLQTWKLPVKHSTTKTVSAALHLKIKKAKRELKVKNKTLPFCFGPKYLGVTVYRSLTYRQHLESLRKKQKADITRRTPEAACWL